MKRILILMSDTGGGHRASAQALKAGFDELYPNRFTIEIVDFITNYMPWPFNQMPKAYPFLSNDAPWLWKLLYGGPNHRLSNTLAQIGSRVLVRSAHRVMDDHRPDLIISVHPLMQRVCMLAMAQRPQRIPFVTVVTDLTTAHPLWFHREVDAVYVASENTRKMALKAGIAPDRIHLLGLPIRPAFARPPRPKADLRSELGMTLELPAVLLMGGGEGVGPVEEIAAACDASLSATGRPIGQIVVICGRNKALQERLAARTWRVPARVNGFVDNMPDWMHACDCIVTKAGPGTIAEALICGLPIILNGFIPGQEEGNVPFVVDNGVGVYEKSPAAIAAIVARWFGPEREHLREMSTRARALGHPHATFDIVRSIVQLMKDSR
ncbi:MULTISPECIES: MGDG synthase family glycosyltransferase [Caldilinea]|nr:MULTISPECIES: glycosyltransferase [Caldilinea]GIV74927.1 MAG: galactosyldiacylglycerol synthase [Caldilinea sp.]